MSRTCSAADMWSGVSEWMTLGEVVAESVKSDLLCFH